MPEGARELSQDFWRPAQAPRIGLDSVLSSACCSNCGTELAIGARFCHVCGLNREPLPAPGSRLGQWTDLSRIVLALNHAREKVGLNLVSFVLLLLGGGCVLAALLTGAIERPATVLQWQAVQTWCIEWMLGAIAALLAALLLRKPSA
ncbi:MAG: zinc ribbon domain-containing protein [Candidatus Korobacteraceae bacterium]|jgi:hypothetical protein